MLVLWIINVINVILLVYTVSHCVFSKHDDEPETYDMEWDHPALKPTPTVEELMNQN